MLLVCPISKKRLDVVPLDAALERMGCARLDTRVVGSGESLPVGMTESVLLREDHAVAYPIKHGFPILLGPERLVPGDGPPLEVDLKAPQYAEAYAEMEFYNKEAEVQAQQIRANGLESSNSHSIRLLSTLISLSDEERARFPDPWARWVVNTVDVESMKDCYKYLSPMTGVTAAQVGGKGTIAVTFLLAGAEQAILVTPMVDEAMVARELARLCGVEDRFHAIVGIGEELPLAEGSIDRCIVGGCIHHMQTEVAFGEIFRALRPGGRFAATEPWKSPFYAIGTSVFGKREPNSFCKPIDQQRLRPLFEQFDTAKAIHHGTITRYAIAVAEKFGLRPSPSLCSKIIEVDDRACSLVPGLRGAGSGLTLLGTKN